jgi:transposase
MWLVGRLVPDHKTIADFRKDNGGAIRKVCAEFVALCRDLDLFTEACVAIDGSKFKAVNSRGRNVTRSKMKRRLEEIEKKVERYLQQLDTADRQEPSVARPNKKTRLADKIATLKEATKRLKALEAEMLAAPDQQISLTDADASLPSGSTRGMATKAHGSGVVGYNVQAAVETTHHLIVAHDVINEGHDRGQLAAMSKMAKAALGVDKLEVLADAGYFSGEKILECDEADITATLPKPLTSGNRLKGRFVKQDFRYVADDDVYICPAGERLIHHYTNVENGLTLRRYWTNVCKDCALRDRCTTGKERRITRWEHEDVVEAVERRLDEHPERMYIGTIKSWMGATHFEMKTLKKVGTEMALHVLAYNLKRVMSILGIGPLIAAMKAA